MPGWRPAARRETCGVLARVLWAQRAAGGEAFGRAVLCFYLFFSHGYYVEVLGGAFVPMPNAGRTAGPRFPAFGGLCFVAVNAGQAVFFLVTIATIKHSQASARLSVMV